MTNINEARPIKSKRRFLKILSLVLICVSICIWFLPAILLKTGLVENKINDSLRATGLKLKINKLSAGWFSPFEARDIQLLNTENEVVCSIPSITTTKSLSKLLLNANELGTITVTAPTVTVSFKNGNSDLEEIITELMANDTSHEGKTPNLILSINDGTIILQDKIANLKSTLSSVKCKLISNNGSNELELSATSNSDDGEAKNGSIEVKYKSNEPDLAIAEIKNVDLKIGLPLLRRLDDKCLLQGLCNGEIKVKQTSQPVHETAIQANVMIEAVEWVSENYLNHEKISLPVINFAYEGIISQDKSITKSLRLDTDIFSVQASDLIIESVNLEDAIVKTRGTINSSLDLAKIAKLIPRTIGLRSDTVVRQGKINLSLSTVAELGSTSILVDMSTTPIVAERNGSVIEWKEPVNAILNAKINPSNTFEIDRFEMNSESIKLSGSGTRENLNFRGRVSLSQIQKQLSQFIDCNQIESRGELEFNVNSTIQEIDTLKIVGKLTCIDLEVKDKTINVREPKVEIGFNAQSRKERDGSQHVQSLNCTLSASQLKSELHLLEPVAQSRILDAKFGGNVVGHIGHYKPIFDLVSSHSAKLDYDVFGEFKIQSFHREAEKLVLSNCSADLSNVIFKGYGINVSEQQLKISPFQLTIDRSSENYKIPNLTMASQTAGVSAKDIQISLEDPDFVSIKLSAVCNADIYRVQKLLIKTSQDRNQTETVGGMIRNAKLTIDSPSQNVYHIQLDCPVQDFSYGTQNTPSWKEKNLHLIAKSDYHVDSGDIQIAELEVSDSHDTVVTTTGHVKDSSGICSLSIKGKVKYNLNNFEKSIKSKIGETFSMKGNGEEEFEIGGNLFDERPLSEQSLPLNAKGSLRWQSINLFGFLMGASVLKAELANNTINVNPILATFGNAGTLRVQPQVLLKASGTELIFNKGKLIENAQLTPEICASALGYALPAIARSAVTNGTISLDLGENLIAIDKIENSTLQSKLTLHSVVVSANPLLTQILELSGVKSTQIALANNQDVQIKIEKGRVYHDQIILSAGEFTFRTTGSVGLDGTMNLMLELPVPESALNVVLKIAPKIRDTVKQKRFQIPIGGTISKPQIDYKRFQVAVREYVEEVSRTAGKEKLNDLLDRGIKKLLPTNPKPPS